MRIDSKCLNLVIVLPLILLYKPQYWNFEFANAAGEELESHSFYFKLELSFFDFLFWNLILGEVGNTNR